MDYTGNVENMKLTEAAENDYSPVFADFMDAMVSKYKIKRIDISRITGISQDYLYKILSGTKHTAQRDYVIAICCAIGMNADETMHALEINGMSSLNTAEERDRLIYESLNQSLSLYKLNDRLEKAGYPWLRVSSDMEEYISKD